MGYNITEEKRIEYRRISLNSIERKRIALEEKGFEPLHEINTPQLNPNSLMPRLPSNGYRMLSLFSGGGGLDLGFDLAGFVHVASYDILNICGKTLTTNRPKWEVYCGENGNVQNVDWFKYRGQVDVLHGGPPCQPFSIAGNQKGEYDERNMWPSFINAVLAIKPQVFMAENVPGLLNPKFSSFVNEVIMKPLQDYFHIHRFVISSEEFGVPQSRKRVILVGFRDKEASSRYKIPEPTHEIEPGLFRLNKCMGAREALGLPDIGFDCIAPTLRSGFTGPRNTTGVVNSKASMVIWDKLQVWPNGVQSNRQKAHLFPPENGHFRLSVQDCAILQGFSPDWAFEGAVYQVLGQIGNSVCPPVAYNLAKSIANALRGSE